MILNQLDDTEAFVNIRRRKSPLCWGCAHWDVGADTCDAYEERIPDEIFLYGYDHRKPFPGDNGIRFEPIES